MFVSARPRSSIITTPLSDLIPFSSNIEDTGEVAETVFRYPNLKVTSIPSDSKAEISASVGWWS